MSRLLAILLIVLLGCSVAMAGPIVWCLPLLGSLCSSLLCLCLCLCLCRPAKEGDSLSACVVRSLSRVVRAVVCVFVLRTLPLRRCSWGLWFAEAGEHLSSSRPRRRARPCTVPRSRPCPCACRGTYIFSSSLLCFVFVPC